MKKLLPIYLYFMSLSMIHFNIDATYLRKELITQNFFQDFKPLETDRIVLRKLEENDLQDLFIIMSDPEVVNQTAALELHLECSESQKLLHAIIKQYERSNAIENDWQLVGIIDKQSQRLVGFCGYFAYSPEFARAEIGYALARSYWGKGLGIEAARLILDFGFTTMNLNRIEATVFPENPASIRVLEKLNMQYEGSLRQHVMRNGKFRDRTIYAILKNDYDKTIIN